MGRDRGHFGRFVGLLEGLGFTAYESRILAYLSLSRESLTASELSSSTGVPRTKIYSTLNSLSEKGLVRLEGARPVRASAPPPSELASVLVEMVINEASGKLSSIDRLFGLNLLEGLWLIEKTLLPIRGAGLTQRIADVVIREAKERINLVFCEKNVKFLPKEFPVIDISAVADSPGSISRLNIPRTRCRIVGKHEVFMVLSERACVFSNEDLSNGIYVSEGSLLSAFFDLFRGLYESGLPLPL